MYSFGCHVSNNLKVNSPKTTDISRVFCFCHCWCQELMDMMFDLSYSVSGEDEVQRGDFRHGRCGLCFQGPLWTAATAVDPIDWWSAFELQKDTMGYHRMHTSIAISINIIHTYIYIYDSCMWCWCHVSNPSSNFPGIVFFKYLGTISLFVVEEPVPLFHAAGGLCSQGCVRRVRRAGGQHVGGAQPSDVVAGRRGGGSGSFNRWPQRRRGRHRAVVPRGVRAGEHGPQRLEAQRAVFGAADVAASIAGGVWSCWSRRDRSGGRGRRRRGRGR